MSGEKFCKEIFLKVFKTVLERIDISQKKQKKRKGLLAIE